MHVLFVAPHFPAYQRRFVRALQQCGARVTGIGEASTHELPGELRSLLYGYEQVSNVCDEQALWDAVRRVQRREWVDRLEATIEAHILPTARVRERGTIPGLSVDAAWLCRDKPTMKEFFRTHGIPTAPSAAISSWVEAESFAKQHGFPLIVKPRDGAGAAGTSRVDNAAELRTALVAGGLDRGASLAIEGFNDGHEGFYDTLTVAGEVAHEFVCHYYPNVLEAMRTRWISPQIITTNRIEDSTYDEVRSLGREVIRHLGVGTSATHMEWFFGSNGLRFSEIGARPPGVGQWDLYCAANDLDLYSEWAHGVVHGRAPARASRRYSAGIIALRPECDGRIEGYEGVDAIQSRYGPWVIDFHLPPAGTPTQPVEAGYMANAWVRLRHPDFDTLRAMLDDVGRTLRVRAR